MPFFNADAEKYYPWSNLEKSIRVKYHGVDDMIANSSLLSLSNGITIICHLNVVSLINNINKLEGFIDEFTRKPDNISISKTKTNNENLKYIAQKEYNFFYNNFGTKVNGVDIISSTQYIALNY